MSVTDETEPAISQTSNGVSATDTIVGLLNQARHSANTGSTVNLTPRRNQDVALLLTQIAMTPLDPEDGAQSSDLVVEDAQADPARPFIGDLLERIRREVDVLHIVVVRLPHEVPTTPFLREAAATLIDHALIVGHPPLQLLRYDPSPFGPMHEEPPLAALLARQRDTVVIVPRADRRLLGGDLVQIGRGLAGSGVAVIAATHLGPEAWGLGAGEQAYWLDLSGEQIYHARFLALELLRGLVERYEQLPAELRLLRPDAIFPGGRTVLQAATMLGSELRIHTLFRLLDLPGGTADPKRALAQAARLPIGEIIRQWFEHLPRRDQLLALALCLLEGLPEAQVFQALELLYEGVWELRGPGQPMLDTIDLAPLADMLQLDGHAMADARLESSVDGLRAAVLPLGVSAHRRHLQYAQLWIARLIKASLDRSSDQPDPLFGPPGLRGRIRAAFGAVLADLALHAPNLALPSLLLLVADPNPEARRIVARALGRWQALGHGDLLIRLIDEWQTNERIRALVGALRGADLSIDPAGNEAAELLQIVGLLALSEAARSVAPGALSDALLAGLTKICQPALTPQAVRVLRAEALPILLHTHITQIAPLLDVLTRYPDLRADLSDDLAQVYQTGGERARAVNFILQGWLAGGLRGGRIRTNTPAEFQLVAAAAVLGAVDYQQGGPISLDGAWRYLSLILKTLEDSAARADVLAACMHLAGQDPRQLRWALREIRAGEEEDVVESLTEICRQQRADLFFRFDANRDERVFWHDQTAKSQIERALITWLLRDPGVGRGDPQEAARLRLLIWRAFCSITRRLDLDNPDAPAPARRPARRPQTGLFDRRKLTPHLLADLVDPDVLPIVRELAPEALDLAEAEPLVSDILLERWQRDPDLGPLGSGLLLTHEIDSADFWGMVQAAGWKPLLRAVIATLRR
jgi:hypothetical protein